MVPGEEFCFNRGLECHIDLESPATVPQIDWYQFPTFDSEEVMPVRHATGEWKGDLKGGKGTVSVESGAFSSPYDFPSRFETGDNTNPEELIGAALAGCFSMALSADLSGAGYKVNSVKTRASVHLNFVDGKPTVDLIELQTEASVDGIEADKFAEVAEGTKGGCPVSRALGAVPIKLEAKLV